MRFPHPHVVQLLGYNVNSRRISIVMEHLDIRLFDVILDRSKRLHRPFTVSEAVRITSKIALGMKFLHSRGVTHGGLSNRTILINVHSQSDFDVKIGGFTFSHHGGHLLRSTDNSLVFALDPDTQAGKIATLRWTTHKDDEEHTCLEIVTLLKTLPIHLSIDPRDVEWRRLIGKGGYSKVYEVNWLGCTLAMKRYKALSANLTEELDFLMKLQHPHIARLIGFSVDSNGGWIMMERVDMDLRKLIDSRIKSLHEAGRVSADPFSDEEARELCLKIALGMNFLHSRRVIHRDSKAANVLVHDHRGRFDVKITDFGISHRIGDSNVVTSAGTRFWRAPEVLKANNDNPLTTEDQLKKTDVYSYAMTCYEILTGNAPFEGAVVDALGRKFHCHVRSSDVIQGCRPKLPAELKADLVKLISDCWNDDPSKRPDFSTICKVLGNSPTWNFKPVALLNQFLRDKLSLFTEGLRKKEYILAENVIF